MRNQDKSPARMSATLVKILEVGKGRLLIAGALFAVAFFVVAVRLFDVATLSRQKDGVAAGKTAEHRVRIRRADIVDRNGVLLATSLPVSALFADPKKVFDPLDAARRIVSVLDHLELAHVEEQLRREIRFVWIERNLTPAQHQRINNLGIPGLYFQEEYRRFYPQANLSAHVVGFTDTDMKGLRGIEKHFDAMLHSGVPVTLSIDIGVQHILREEIARQIAEFNGIGGAGVIQDVDTGEIVAMVSLPDFNPAKAKNAPAEVRFNRAVQGRYEMGSTLKILNTTLALESGVGTMQSIFDATHPIRFGRFIINDYHPKRRPLSLPEVFVYSSNIGSVKIALKYGTAAQVAFMRDLGLHERVPLELPERSSPLLPTPWREINTVTIAFGHGIAITPVHLTDAVSTIVNGGMRWPVTLLKRTSVDDTIVATRVISEKTAASIRRLLRLVVTNGTGSKADASGYLVGGKTGTAEKPGKTGRYVRRKLLSSFVSAFPIHDPRYVVMVMIDEPKGTRKSHGFATGGWVAAPAVKRIVARSAQLLGIHPIAEDSPEIRQILDLKLEPPSTGQHRLASF